MYKGYIYRHWLINDKGQEKSYIGQVYRITRKFEPQDRWGSNGKGYAPKKGEKPTHFYNAICKYGWDNFSHKILLTIECETKEELVFWLNEWEKYFVWYYDSYYNGYNSTLGGEGTLGHKLTNEQRKKFSDVQKGRVISKEHKAKISKTMIENGTVKGDNNPRWNGKVICLNTLEVFTSSAEAEKYFGLKGGISPCCKGQRKTSGKHPVTGEKLKWMYYDEWLKFNTDKIDSVTDVA